MKKFFGILCGIGVLLVSTCFAGTKPIVVFGTMKVEVSHLMDKLENPKTMTVAGHNCVKGMVDGYPVVVFETRMGMVNASSAATIAIEKFKPIYALTTGTAGAHRDDLKIGDIILCEKLCNSNVYVSEYRPRGAGSNGNDWEYQDSEIFINGDWDRVRYLYSNRKLLTIAQKVPYKHGGLMLGITTSGDVWNRECDEIDFIRKNYNTDCEDMESFAIASVCTKYDVPFLGVRVICNNEFLDTSADEDRELVGEDFYVVPAKNAQEYIYKVLKEIIKSVKK